MRQIYEGTCNEMDINVQMPRKHVIGDLSVHWNQCEMSTTILV